MRHRWPAVWILPVAVFSCVFWCGLSAADYPKPLYSEEGHDISFYLPPESKDPFFNLPGLPLRNIVICIGDGMGLSQVALARYRGTGADGKLWMERLPVTGWVRTHNSEGQVTDSAAAITAMVCGVKTKNGIIGQTPDGTSWMTLDGRLQQEGYRVGAVATCTITHATPAGFAAHVPKRGAEADIAVQMLDAKMDVLFGGGRKYWLPKSVDGGVRKDHRNFLAEARQMGYRIVQDRKGMKSVSSGPVIGLFSEDAMTTVAPEPSLAEMTRAALRILTDGSEDASAPFVLLVEGSQIDWACHINNANACVRQTLLFDMAVREVLKFAVLDQHTLVLVTADHETGGLVLLEGDKDKDTVKVSWATKDHSASQVPLFAFGPGAEQFAGVLDNTEIALKIAQLLALEDFPQPLPKAGVRSEENEKEFVSQISSD